MKIILFLILIITFYSCSSKSSVDKSRDEKILVFQKSELKKFDSTATLDSLRTISSRNIKDNDLYYMRIIKLGDTLSYNNKTEKLKQEKLETYLQMLRLSIGVSKVLTQTYKEDVQKLLQEVKSGIKRDSEDLLRMDDLSAKMKKSDTVTMRYVEIKSLMQYHRADLSVARDTVFTVFDKMNNLIRVSDVK